jgi:hypothetical protein
MRKSLKRVLIQRDDLTEEEADELIAEAKEEFHRMLENGEDPSDICETFFGLEPDYLDDFI